MFRIAVCDDHRVLCSQLERVILEYRGMFSDSLSVEVFESGEDMLDFLSDNEAFDLVFLDIEMKSINGVEAGIRLRNEMHHEITHIVYISGKDNYYRELFQVRPLNFLHKPISDKEVIAEIEKAASLSEKGRRIFTFQKNRGVFKRYAGDILYFEGYKGRQIKLVTARESIIFYGKLAEVLEELSDSHFFCCHQSFVANYHHVAGFHANELSMTNGDILPIGPKKRGEVEQIQKQMWEGLL